MSESPPAELLNRVERHGQAHLLRWWDELGAPQRRALAEQIELIDFDAVGSITRSSPQAKAAGDADRFEPALQIIRRPKTAADRDAMAAATEAGNAALVAGKVGVILVAGGQGTRLGFNSPKGMFPIGPVSQSSLFQILAEQLLARSRQAGQAIPYYIMTSDATHYETVAFFEGCNFFGLNADDVRFFRQGKMPATDMQTGRLLLADKGAPAMSPDGHGGMLEALVRNGCLADMTSRGVEYLYYHQVDNPTAIVCDPAFLGFHILRKSEMTTKVVAKRSPDEKMGVVVDVAGQTRVVEYIDLPAELARRTDADGNPLFWAGNMAIHVLDRAFLDRLIAEEVRLPLHPSAKVVPCIDEVGREVSPTKPNAYKFERFIFDALPHARRTLVVEADRAREFNPVKNAAGDDSPASVKAAISAIFADWLRAADIDVPAGAPVEICPLFALDEYETRKKLPKGKQFDGPILLQ